MLCLIKYVSDEILINVEALFVCVDFHRNKQLKSKKDLKEVLLIW